MGWWWASSTPSDSASSSQPSASTPTSMPAPTSTPMAPSIPQNAQPDPPRNEEAEFNAAFPHLAPQSSTSDSSSSSSQSQSQSQSSSSLSPEYPTTMSCRAAFDSAFYCTSLGGHFNHVYRYGELRSCSEHWADWRFCMGLKTRTKSDKELLIQERYREKEEKVKSKPNSEYVWERLSEKERHFGAFKPAEEEAGPR